MPICHTISLLYVYYIKRYLRQSPLNHSLKNTDLCIKKRGLAPPWCLEAPPSIVAEVILHATSEGKSTLCQGFLGILKSLEVLLRATAHWPLFGVKRTDVGHVGLEGLNFVSFSALHCVTSLLTGH